MRLGIHSVPWININGLIRLVRLRVAARTDTNASTSVEAASCESFAPEIVEKIRRNFVRPQVLTGVAAPVARAG